ncbi:MAG TPA: glycosyltransferase family 39 protein [Chloroflexota bacterium]|nr:glycosyltransferase family 39 protein [Chloroflexota bacterium]
MALPGLVALVSVGLRLPFLSVPLITDEGGYAYVAHWLARGATLYRDLWFDRPQAIFLVYGAQLALLGESTEAIRLGAALYNVATCVALYALGVRLCSHVVGLGAAGLFAVASASPAIEGFTANGELYMALPMVLSLLCAARGWWWASGLCGALACALKPTALLAVAPPLAAVWWHDVRSLRAAVFCALGGLVGVAPFVAHGVLTDGAGYWYALVGFRVSAHSAFSAGGALLRDFLQTAPTTLAALAPLWLLAAWGARSAWSRRERSVGAAFLGGSLLGAAAGGHWYWHYYVGLVPAAALLGAYALSSPTPRWLPPTLGILLLPTLYFNARLVGATPEETSLRIYERPAYVASGEIAAHVRAGTRESDRVYVAFAQADLYHLSGRRSAGRHLYWTEINRVPGAFDELLTTMRDGTLRPAYVIEIDRELERPGRAAPFWDEVARHYEVEREIGGYRLFRVRAR